MSKKIIKRLSMSLALCTVAMLFSSCGEGGNTTTPTTTTAGGSTTTAASTTASSTATTGNGTTTTTQEGTGMTTTTTEAKTATTTAATKPVVQEASYDLDIFTQNLFEGNTAYYDSVVFAEDASGKIGDGVLLYTPTKVMSVYSADLKTLYEEGKDYTVKGNTLVRTKDSRIPVFKYSQYCQAVSGVAANNWLRIVGTDLELKIGPDILKYQVMVTYTHGDSWKGAKIASQLSELPNTASLLKSKKDMKIVFFGDSITCGYDASGQNERVLLWETNTEASAVSNRAPYMPSWAEMITAKLRKTYQNDSIVKVNRGSGGASTYWGKTAADSMVNSQNPDLVVIAFGMNQSGNSREAFAADIKQIVETIHGAHPKTEFLLVSCMMPNTDSVTFRKHQLAKQEQALYDVQAALPEVGIGVVPVHSVFQSIIDAGKKYTDFTSNNINHPNDFAGRIYAQAILTALEG